MPTAMGPMKKGRRKHPARSQDPNGVCSEMIEPAPQSPRDGQLDEIIRQACESSVNRTISSNPYPGREAGVDDCDLLSAVVLNRFIPKRWLTIIYTWVHG